MIAAKMRRNENHPAEQQEEKGGRVGRIADFR